MCLSSRARCVRSTIAHRSRNRAARTTVIAQSGRLLCSGFYLWHMTAIAVVVQLLPRVNVWLIPSAFILALVPTLLSWYLIEQPALSLKRYAPMRPAEIGLPTVAGS
jgi:hypothetical protein